MRAGFVSILCTDLGWATIAPAVPGPQGRSASSPAACVPIAGRVTYDGPLPKPILVPEAGTARHLVEIDPATSGLKDAVVWLAGPRPAGTTCPKRRR